jgi:hypothetical protein
MGHTGDGVFAILGAVKEIAARVVLRHEGLWLKNEVAIENALRFRVIQKFPSATQ